MSTEKKLYGETWKFTKKLSLICDNHMGLKNQPQNFKKVKNLSNFVFIPQFLHFPA